MPNAAPVLAATGADGQETAILSNGTPTGLERAVHSAGLADWLDPSLSAETAPAVNGTVCDLYGFRPEVISFPSSNRWDVAGFGFRTVWINRSGTPDEYLDLPPPLVVASVSALLDA
jgi:2-haloacid dehalogenase